MICLHIGCNQKGFIWDKARKRVLKQLETDYKELKTYNKIAEKYDVTMYTTKWWFEKMRNMIEKK